MRKITFLSTVVLCGLLAVSCMSPQQKIDSIAKKLNKDCPIEVGNGAGSIISAESLPEKTLKMNFQINSTLDLDEPTRAMLIEAMKTIFVSMADTDYLFKKIKKMEATVIVSIVTPNNEAMDIVINPDDFKNVEKVQLTKGGMDSEDNVQTILKTMATSFQKQLPMVDEETGIKTIDCYVERMTLVTVGELPDEFLEEVIEEGDSDTFVALLKQMMVEMIKEDPSMKYVVDKGVTVKYIYKKTDGSVFVEQDVSKADL